MEQEIIDWVEKIKDVPNMETFNSITFQEFITSIPDEITNQFDSYLLSPAYYEFTGRKGAWMYRTDDSFTVICWHPNKKGKILIFPTISNKGYNAGTTVLSKIINQLPASSNGIQLARLNKEGALLYKKDIERNLFSEKIGIIPAKETLLDWLFPSYTLSTSSIEKLQGSKFQHIRQRINKLNREDIIIEKLDAHIHRPELIELISKWAYEFNYDDYQLEDLLSPGIKLLDMMQQEHSKLSGQVIRYKNKIESFCIWEKPITGILPANELAIAASKDIKGLSELQMVEMCKALKEDGIEYVNIGGSESTGLDLYKKRFNPVSSHEMGTMEIYLNIPERLICLANQIENCRKQIEDTLIFFIRDYNNNGQKIYYDLRSKQLSEPFCSIIKFLKNHTKNLNAAMSDLVLSYNGVDGQQAIDNIVLYLETISSSQEDKNVIRTIQNELEHFSLMARDFYFCFSDRKDHDTEFGYWPGRTHMTNFYEKGILIACNVLKYIKSEYEKNNQLIAQDQSAIYKIVDTYLRKTIATQYAFNDTFTFEKCEENRLKLRVLANKGYRLLTEFENIICFAPNLNGLSAEQKKLIEKIIFYYQTPFNGEFCVDLYDKNGKYKHPFGFELEYDTGYKIKESNIITFNQVRDSLISQGFPMLRTEKSQDVFNPEVSDGVLHFDPAMPYSIESVPMEYSSPIIYEPSQRKHYIGVLEFIKERGGFIDDREGVDIHISKENVTIDAQKRVMIRYARHENEIMASIYPELRREDYTLYTTTLLSQLGANSTEEDRNKNFMIYSGMVNLATNQDELSALANSNNRNRNINCTPTQTFEIRGLQGTLDTVFMNEYIDFLHSFFTAAYENTPIHYDKEQLERLQQLSVSDKTDRRKSPYYPKYHHDLFNPKEFLPEKTKKALIDYSHLVAEIIRSSGYLPVPNVLSIGNHRINKISSYQNKMEKRERGSHERES